MQDTVQVKQRFKKCCEIWKILKKWGTLVLIGIIQSCRRSSCNKSEFNTSYPSYILTFLWINKYWVFFRYQLLHSEELLKAFQALDTEAKGYLDIEEAKSYFTRHGEAFAQVIIFFTNFAAFCYYLCRCLENMRSIVSFYFIWLFRKKLTRCWMPLLMQTLRRFHIELLFIF